MPLNENQLRLVMRKWASGVSVVTSQFEGIKHGMTVSSFTSVSLIPPLVTISLMKSSRTLELVRLSRSFGITLLTTQQEEISKIFAGQVSESDDRFSGIDTFTLLTGAPMIANGLAFFDCKISDILNFDTNALIIGEVVATKLGDQSSPLLYFDQRYRELQD
jgi:flavin reductase (DIM6/NTAB) family NADH-FMN oxidoreductase RutF